MGRKLRKTKKKTGASGKGHRNAGGGAQTNAGAQGHENVNPADQGIGSEDVEASRADEVDQEQRNGGNEPETEGACAMVPETRDGTVTPSSDEAQYMKQNIKATCVQVGDHNVMKGVQSTGGSFTEDTESEDDEVVDCSGPVGQKPKVTVRTDTVTKEKYEQNISRTADGVKEKHKQTIKGNIVNVTNKFVQNIQSQAQVTQPRKPLDSPMKSFLETVEDFNEGHYILINGDTSGKHLEAMSLVPWIAVFDFDPESKTKGLLSYVEDNMQKKRKMNLLTWQDKCTIKEESTCWLFTRGHTERADSRVDGNIKSWKARTKEGIRQQIQQIERFTRGYTSITVVVLWPTDSSIAQHIYHILYEMEDFSPRILLIDDLSVDRSIEDIYKTLKDHEIEVERECISIREVCNAISYALTPSAEDGNCVYNLPTSDGIRDVRISHDEAFYLQEDLDVLYMDNKTGVEYSLDTIKEEEDTFFRGGTLPWAFWYATGAGHIDIERDILVRMKEYITTKRIAKVRSGCVTLYHAPGSGGTTLAQRILWDLHTQTPCVQVKHNDALSPQAIADRIEFLFEKTRLPILVLIDGEEEQNVERVERLLQDIPFVILYVKRSISGSKVVGKNKAKFYIRQCVSVREAQCLGSKYIDRVREKKKQKSIRKLVEDVSTGKDRMLFDFGLAVHSYEYKGIEAYVRGFLKLEGQSTHFPWQRALGYLSLALYYGHTGIPCHFFSEMLLQNKQRVLQISDFPDEMQEFIVRNHNDGRKRVARITHYFVAKEILDQLMCPKQISRQLSPSIDAETKRNIAPFAITFIQYSSDVAIGESAIHPTKAITNIFTSRDNRRVGENVPEMINKKKRFSQILEDVSCAAPYTERFDILNQLVKSFPRDPLLRAHLGRLYVICRPEMETEAEDCFKEALSISHRNEDSVSKETMSVDKQTTLSHVHHMFGYMYLRRAQSKCSPKKLDTLRFHTIAAGLLQLVSKACEHFESCRGITPDGMEESYGYIGEIQARLLFCGFIRKHCNSDVLDFAKKALATEGKFQKQMAIFIRDTFACVDQLFVDCLSTIEPDKMNFPIKQCQMLYANLFQAKEPGHLILNTCTANNTERRFQIAFLKSTYRGRNHPYACLELVNKKEDLIFIVKRYEENMTEAFRDRNVFLSSRRDMDIDFREWLFAIRHVYFSDDYSIEKVLKFVQRWYDTLKSPFSRFYLFVLKSILGFGSDTGVNTELQRQALSLRGEMSKCSKFMTKPGYPLEWLGSGAKGIRRMTPGSRFFGRNTRPRELCTELQTLKGTIRYPNIKATGGWIELDLGPDNRIPITAFYVPGKLKGKVFARKRVQFTLAFTLSHGYDAYNVELLPTMKCKKCEYPKVEIRRCDSEVCCPRCKEKHRLNTKFPRK